MRNLKKVLALALAFALAFSVMANAVTYIDSAESSPDGIVQAAMDVMYDFGIMIGSGGKDAASSEFHPTETLSRAEVTSVIFALMNKGNANALKASVFAGLNLPFKDVPTDPATWYRGALGYCYTNKLISGKSATVFDPDGDITTQELATILLVAIGYDKNDLAKEWPANVLRYGLEKGLFDNVIADMNEGIPRQYVAVMVLNALRAVPVTKNANGTYSDVPVNTTAHFKAVVSLDDILGSLLTIDKEYDQLSYKLFKKTIHLFMDQRAMYIANSTTSLTKAAKPGSGILLDVLKSPYSAYVDDYHISSSNVAFTIGTPIVPSTEEAPLGSIVNTSYYGIINYNYSIIAGSDGTDGGSSGTAPDTDLYIAGRNYNVSYKVVTVKPSPVSTDGNLNNQNFIYTNITTGLTAGGTIEDKKAKNTTLAFTGTENDVLNGKTTENGNYTKAVNLVNTYYSINGAAPVALVADEALGTAIPTNQYSAIANILMANADRAFNTVNMIVTNKGGQIIYVSMVQRQIAKVTKVKSGKVTLVNKGASADFDKAKFVKDDGTAYDFGADRDLATPYANEGLYIAYYEKGGKYYTVSLTATREKIAYNANTAIYNANDVELSNYDPYVDAAEKIDNSTTAKAVALVGKTFDIIRGPAGMILAAFNVTTTTAPSGPVAMPLGIITAVKHADAIPAATPFDTATPEIFKAQILTADGSKTIYDVTKVGGAAVTSGSLDDGLNKLVTYTIKDGKLEYTVLNDNVADFDGTQIDVNTTSSGNVINDGTNNYILNANATVFTAVKADTTYTWSVKNPSQILDQDKDTAAGEDDIVYDTNATTGYKYAKAWVVVDSAIETPVATPTPTPVTYDTIVLATEDTNSANNVSFDGTDYLYVLFGLSNGVYGYDFYVTKASDFKFEDGNYYKITYNNDGEIIAVAAAPSPDFTGSIVSYDAAAKKMQIGSTTYTLDANVKVMAYTGTAGTTADMDVTKADVPASLVGKNVTYAIVSGGKVMVIYVDLD